MNPNASQHVMREYIDRQHFIEANKYLSAVTEAETRLWHFAKRAPYGAKVIFTNPDGSDPYLLRVYLTPERKDLAKSLLDLGLPMGVAKLALLSPRPYLHYFFRGDDDRAFHNHPWQESLSFVLTKGYREWRWDFKANAASTRVVHPGQFNLIRRKDFHKVELLPAGGCWTLFTSGRPVDLPEGEDWDFFNPEDGSYTPWGKWTAQQERLARVG